MEGTSVMIGEEARMAREGATETMGWGYCDDDSLEVKDLHSHVRIAF